MRARAHRERQWEPRGNGTGTEQQREPAGLCSHTHAESGRVRRTDARVLLGREVHHSCPLSSVPCVRVHTERDSGSREETGRVRSSRESLRASAATHTQRERERGEWQHASSWDGSCITCLLSPLCHACACTLRETVGAARKRDGYGAAERACGPLQPHTRRERERGEWQHA